MPNQEKQNPLPIVLLIIIALGIPLIIVAINLGFNPFVSAGPTEEPKTVVTSNLSANTATVTFFTPQAATDSIIKYGTTADATTLIATDRRDFNSGTSGAYISHIVDLGNLQPNTQYFYLIVIGGKEYKNNGVPYTLKTLPSTDSLSTPNPVYGKISPETPGTIIYNHAIRDGVSSTSASAIIAPNGTFTFDLSTLKDDTTGAVFDTTGGKIITFAQSPTGEIGAVSYPATEKPGTITMQTGSSIVYSTQLDNVPNNVTPTTTPVVSATPTNQVTTTPTTTGVVTQTPVPTTTGGSQPDADSLLLISDSFSSGAEQIDATVPYQIFISNISATNFSVNWRTNEPTVSTVAVEGQNQIYLDDRDSSQLAAKKRYTHKMTINTSSLATGSTVRFTPLSNNKRFSKTFAFVIPALTSSPPTPDNISGTVTKQYAPLNDRDLIIFGRKTSGTGRSSWKSIVPESANFVLPVGDAYNQQLTGYFQATAPEVELRAMGEFNGLTLTTAALTSTPTLQQQTGLALTTVSQNATLTSVPAIRGTAVPNSTVNISINNTSNSATADSSGNWALANPQGLAIGTNQISLSSGGSVMGVSFTLNLSNLPATDLRDNLPLFGAALLIVAGFYLQRKASRAQRSAH